MLKEVEIESLTQDLALGVHGATKSGRTHLALTGKQPIYYYDFDLGFKRAAPNVALQVGNIEVVRGVYNLGTHVRDFNYMEEVWAEFLRDWDTGLNALAGRGGGTMVTDTDSVEWQWIYALKLHELQLRKMKKEKTKLIVGKNYEAAKNLEPEDIQTFPFDYAEANQVMEQLVLSAQTVPGVDSIFISRDEEIFDAQGKATGLYRRQGYKMMETLVGAMVKLEPVGKDHGRRVVVEACGLKPNKAGTIVEEPTIEKIREAVNA